MIRPGAARRLGAAAATTATRRFRCFSGCRLPLHPKRLLNPTRASSTFVSSHFRVDEAELERYLRRKDLALKHTPSHFIVRECPFCTKPHRGKADNLWKLYIKREDGAFFCHRCGSRGSMFDLKAKLGDVPTTSRFGGKQGPQSLVDVVESALSAREAGGTADDAAPRLPDNETAASYCRDLIEGRHDDVLTYLTKTRGLSPAVLRKYGVGASNFSFRGDAGWERHPCVVFPWLITSEQLAAAKRQDAELRGRGGRPATQAAAADGDAAGQGGVIPLRLKIRSVLNKAFQRIDPAGGPWGLFGLHTVPPSATSVVLTEGEFDALAVHQATGLPALSLPNGCRSLPVEVLPLLERFESIVLWMDDDVPGQEGAEKFAEKLGRGRCLIVRSTGPEPKPKDANEALLAGADLGALVKAASPVPHEQIVTFRDLREEVFREVAQPLEQCGAQCKSLPSLNRILKGHRRGELSIFTGPTGSGKTTLLSQLSLDYCAQGVSTLWGSFEIKNTRLIKKMLQQHSASFAHLLESQDGTPTTATATDPERLSLSEGFERAADEFEKLPMFFTRFFGSTDVDQVLDAMEYATYVYDVEHIVLDNLQFMMSGQGRGFDKFELQERALEKFRRFATNKNVHLTLVIHPRKEPENAKLSMSSVFGTAKATQEADNVLILQKVGAEKSLEIRKNRFDGTLGTIPLVFDGRSQQFLDVSGAEIEAPSTGAPQRQPQHQPQHQPQQLQAPSLAVRGPAQEESLRQTAALLLDRRGAARTEQAGALRFGRMYTGGGSAGGGAPHPTGTGTVNGSSPTRREDKAESQASEAHPLDSRILFE